MTPGGRNRLAIALLAAPALIGFPMLRDLARDPRFAIEHWDMVLLFLALPYAAAAILAGEEAGRDRDPS